MTGPLAVELFAGAGGAALGLRAAGFEAVACVDVMPDAVLTLQADHPWQARTKADLYRLIGNAVPPRLAEVVGQAMVRRVEA